MIKTRFKIIMLLAASLLFFLFPTIANSKQLNFLTGQGSSYQQAPYQDYHFFLPIISNQLGGYFVAPNGSDSNPGSQALPWKTIRKAAQAVKPGDIVYIRSGVYFESVPFQISGTETQPITIKAYPGENPIIDGNYLGSWGILVQVMGNYINLSGIEIRNSTGQGINITGSYDVVDNIYVHHCMAAGVIISRGQHSIVQNSRVWRASLKNENGQNGSWASGLSVARNNVSYVTIRNNVVWENWGEGISSYEADHITIIGNVIHDNYSANLYISDSTNVFCSQNFVFMNPESYVFGHGANGGIMLGDESYNPPSANITIINNIAFGNHSNLWWWQGVKGGGMNNVLIANNTFINGVGNANEGRGGVTISRGNHQNVRFVNNLVQQDDELPVIATISQSGITYSHNLWSKAPYAAASSTTDVIGDPLLTHLGGRPFAPEWYKLSGVSPAINKGLLIPEVTNDFFGNSRSISIDIGAVENIP